MPVTEGNIEVINTGKFLDTTEVTQTDGLEVQREVVVIGDPSTLANYAEVTSSDPTISDIGLVTRSLSYGVRDNNSVKMLQLTGENHLEVAIHDPVLPFGALHVENLTPVFQVDALYGINATEVLQTTGLAFESNPPTPGANSGANTGTNNLLTCATGTTAFSFASMQSRARLKYRPGQGVLGRFSALWSSPAASSIVVAGMGNPESGVFFGYNGTSFGILYSTGGVRCIQTLTITTRTTTGGTVIFRLNGLDYTVTIPAGATTQRTAYDISLQTFPGWSVASVGSTVVFLASSVGVRAGAFTLTNGTAVGTVGAFAQTLAGAAATDTWVPQASWNGDKLNGTGPSGVTLDPSKGNVFEIGIQYLGFGAVTFRVETIASDGNNATPTLVHTLNIPNSRTTVSFSMPSFPFTMAAYSAGSTTNVSVSVGSFAGFIEGNQVITGPRFTYPTEDASFVGSAAGTYYPLTTIRNGLVFNGRANQCPVTILSVGAASADATPTTLFLIKNATLLGPVNFTTWSTSSVTFVDTSATTCTFSDNNQIVATLPIGNGGADFESFDNEITLQPGERITVAARGVTGTVTYFLSTLDTQEDN